MYILTVSFTFILAVIIIGYFSVLTVSFTLFLAVIIILNRKKKRGAKFPRVFRGCQIPGGMAYSLGNLAWGCQIPWGAKFPVTPGSLLLYANLLLVEEGAWGGGSLETTNNNQWWISVLALPHTSYGRTIMVGQPGHRSATIG